MAYTEFSSNKADYVLHLENHARRRDLKVFKGIDAAVIESGFVHPEEVLSTSLGKDIADYCKEHVLPIYFVDCAHSGNINIHTALLRDNFSIAILGLPVEPICWHYANNDIKAEGLISKLCSTATYLWQSPTIECRNAIAARKIEEFIAPDLQKRLAKRPKIGITYGAMHIGLREDLLSKKRRNLTLLNWKYLNFRKYSPFDIHAMNMIYWYEHNGLDWVGEKTVTNLF